MLSSRSLLPGLPEAEEITSIAFETSDPVDDFRVELSDKSIIYFQAKRSLSFSSLPTSELYDALRQCIRQFIKSPGNHDLLVLAVSPDASSRVREVLPELLDRYRQHQDGPDTTTLNKTQEETLTQFRDLISALLSAEGHPAWSPDTFASFARSLNVFTFDIDTSGSHEVVAQLLLEPLSKYPSSLLWTKLISLALDASKKRRRFDRGGLRTTLKSYLRPEPTVGQPDPADEQREWSATFTNMGPPSVANDVLLAVLTSPDSDRPLTLFQVARFAADDRARVRYKDGMFTAGVFSGKVLLRAATWAGMARLIELRPEVTTEKTVTIIEPNEGPQDESFHLTERQIALASLLESGVKGLECLRCGRFVLQEQALTVEIDEDGHNHQAGVVHDRCHRPCDRVLGTLNNEQARTLPSDFDIPAWIRLEKSGQGASASIKQAKRLGHRLAKIVWNPDNEQEWTKNWCVEIELASGHCHYATTRGKLIRLSQSDARRKSAEMQTQMEAMLRTGRPFQMTTVSGKMGNDETVIDLHKLKDADEEVSFVRAVRAVLVTREILRRYPPKNFYAPLLYLIDPITEDPIDLGGVRSFFSDPTIVPELILRWRKAGFFKGEYSARIIGSDAEFDRMTTRAIEEGRRIVIDPEFDEQWFLCSGGEVENINVLLNNARRPALALVEHRQARKIGRNDPCPCGSGKKYKRCCWLTESS